MKLKLLVLAIGISLLNIMCCGSGSQSYNLKYTPDGKVLILNKDSRYENVMDTVKGSFKVRIEFEMEQVFTNNFSIVPTAMACDVNEPYPLNYSNIEKLSLSIDKSFLYKNSRIEEGANFIDIDDKQYFYVEYRYNPNYIIVDDRFLNHTKFNKGWTTFTIAGELEDGQLLSLKKKYI
jgi:hypothetical protein